MRSWLAIDPGFRNTGWAWMDEQDIFDVGLIRTERDKGSLVYLDNLRCLEELACGIGDIALPAADRVQLYAEAKGGSKSAKAAAAMAMAQGVMVGRLCADYDITLMLPQEVKKRVCGNRSASKADIVAAVDELYPDARLVMKNRGYTAKKYTEHIYDAIAIGWAIHQSKGES